MTPLQPNIYVSCTQAIYIAPHKKHNVQFHQLSIMVLLLLILSLFLSILRRSASHPFQLRMVCCKSSMSETMFICHPTMSSQDWGEVRGGGAVGREFLQLCQYFSARTARDRVNAISFPEFQDNYAGVVSDER